MGRTYSSSHELPRIEADWGRLSIRGFFCFSAYTFRLPGVAEFVRLRRMCRSLSLLFVSLFATVVFPARDSGAQPVVAGERTLPSAVLRIVTLDDKAPFISERWPVSAALPFCDNFQSADVDGDGRAEFVALRGSALLVGRNTNRSFELQTISLSSDATKVTAGKFRCGKEAQLVVASGKALFLVDPSSGIKSEIVSPSEPFGEVVEVAAGDVTDDGQDELVVLDRANRVAIYALAVDGPKVLASRLSIRAVEPEDDMLFVDHFVGGGHASAIRLSSGSGATYSGFTSFVHFGLTDNTVQRNWGQLERPITPQIIAKGDFNADGRTDLLVFAGSVYRWWMMQSVGEVSAEIPVGGIQADAASREAAAGGDYDGDGADDVLICNSRRPELVVARSSFASPLSIPEASVEGARMLAPGLYGFDIEPERQPVLRIPGYRAQYTSWQPRGSARRCSPRALNAVGISEAEDRKVVGQALRIGPPAQGPFVCTGFNPAGLVKWPARSHRCAAGYAFFAADDLGGPRRPKDEMAFSGSCCRLPSDDILTDEVVLSETDCPESTVAVGVESDEGCVSCRWRFACQKLNLERYRLGPSIPGRYFGSGVAGKSSADGIAEHDIPLAIRPGALRWSYAKQQVDGCVGMPFGSVAVSRGRACGEIFFRQIQYAGRDGDPKAGTPVKMYPECAALDDPFSPTAGCIVRRDR